MGRGRSIFSAAVYFMDLSICAKFQGRSSRASYLSQGSLMKMPSVKHASGAILGSVYLDEWARYSRPGFVLWYCAISNTILPSFVCIADTVSKLRARQLGRNRRIKPSGKYVSGAILGHVYLDAEARYSRTDFTLQYCPTNATILASFAGTSVFVVKWRDRELDRSSNFASNTGYAKFAKSERRNNKSL